MALRTCQVFENLAGLEKDVGGVMVGEVMDAGDVARFVGEAGIVAEVVRLAVETPTVAAAAAAVGGSMEQIVKSLLFLVDGAQVRQILGYEVGAVPPFGHKTPVRTVVEAGVLLQEEIWAGGGSIDTLVRLRVAELRRVVGEETAQLTGE